MYCYSVVVWKLQSLAGNRIKSASVSGCSSDASSKPCCFWQSWRRLMRRIHVRQCHERQTFIMQLRMHTHLLACTPTQTVKQLQRLGRCCHAMVSLSACFPFLHAQASSAARQSKAPAAKKCNNARSRSYENRGASLITKTDCSISLHTNTPTPRTD